MGIWLSDLGFVYGNPFAHVEADRERAFLPRFFVPVAGYDHIAGNDTVVVFAPRGSGKSALRVMLASECAPQDARGSYLAVEFTNFDILSQKQARGEPILIDDYVVRLLQAAVRGFWQVLDGPSQQAIANKTDTTYRLERARSISPAGRTLLTRFVAMYYPELLYPAGLHRWFCQMDAGFALSLEDVAEAVTERCLRQRLAATALAAQPLALLLAEMSDLREMAMTPAGEPREELAGFVQLVQEAGIVAVHFLIDRLDENEITVNNPEAQADILEPLLANLPVLELPGTAFKFFLAQETHEVLTGRWSFRLDRLRTQAPVTVRWDRAQLVALLNARINVYSDGRYEEFVMLWAGQAPAGQIEQEMLDLALGSPRRLLTAGQLLFEVHFEGETDGPPTLASWEIAKTKLLQRLPPPLCWRVVEQTLWLGENRIKLSKQEMKIVAVLVDHAGRCTREELINGVWGEDEFDTSDEALTAAMKRLRAKLGHPAIADRYLRTEPGRGYALINYELSE